MEINGISNSYFFDTEFVPNAEVYPTENPIIAGDFYGDFFNEPQMRVLRVAAYVRVSTEHEEQEESFELQKAYFEELLNENPNWISVGIYSDFGVSATSREKRTGFNRLMRHCEEGRIDRIITKSISRFARNTYDFLNALDILKKNNITIAFEKERIDTAIVQNDMMLTAFGAVAQEESRSISANIRWAVEKGVVEEAPDYLHFDEHIFRTYFSGMTANGDEICYTTTFGLKLKTTGNTRPIGSYLGFRVCKPDGTAELVTQNYQISNASIQHHWREPWLYMKKAEMGEE